MRRVTLSALLAQCLFLCCTQVKTISHSPLPSAIPRLTITNDTTATALKISSLTVDIVVAANTATTTFDIVFYNPNEKILEGEFDFPLADGQAISRYALDVNGKLREAVVVEKAKARVAFETTVRRGIDPGLVEKTKGNNFRTRIYPLPAKGFRHILIAVEQSLDKHNKDYVYQLPLYTSEKIDDFSLKTTVIKSEIAPKIEESGLSNFRFHKWNEAYVATFQQKNFTASQTLVFTIPSSTENEDIVLTENYKNQSYFYINSRIEPQFKEKQMPAKIGLIWDVSGSGEKRNIERELQLLQEYLSRFSSVIVSLIPFNVSAGTPEDFIVNGNPSDLLKRIRSLDYDGGTQLGSVDLSRYPVDEFLLFSDGLSTFGKKEMSFSSAPVMTINSSSSADYSMLKYIAQQSHGKFIDLGRLDVRQALDELGGQALQVINIRYKKDEIESIVMPVTPIGQTGLSIAGRLTASHASIDIDLGFDKEVIITKHFTITKKDSSEYDQVKRLWASMRIAQLDLRYEDNKDAITQLGKEFSVVTQNTSLIVLDRVEDYVEHEITPPAELQKEYFALLEEKKNMEKEVKNTGLEEALGAMAELRSWYASNFPTGKGKKLTTTVIEDHNIVGSIATSPYTVADSTRLTRNFALSEVSVNKMADDGLVEEMRVQEPPPAQEDLESAQMEDYKQSPSSLSSIDLAEWKPDVPYLKTLEETPAKDRKKKYLDLKKQYSSQPSFFVDVARFFIEKQEKEWGIQVLSNISEMKLEDASLLRIVANQLLEAGETELALLEFQEILQLREEEPQSLRDLAIAYNESGQYDKAVSVLYKLAIGNWDSRFGDVKGIALNEMNAIIGAHPGVNATAIDKRLIQAMPVDVRIVIGWNADNADVDLWVTDPQKEKCSYENTQTRIGGRISSDVTQGYGPEEFLLKKALKGNYSIQVNLYGDSRQTLGGPIAITAQLFTDYGRPQQKRKTINLRVTSNKEVIDLGALKFGS